MIQVTQAMLALFTLLQILIYSSRVTASIFSGAHACSTTRKRMAVKDMVGPNTDSAGFWKMRRTSGDSENQAQTRG